MQVNRYATRLLGDEREVTGPRDISVPFRLFDGEREVAFWEQPLQRAAFTGQPVPPMEARLVRPGGVSLDVMVSAEPLFDEEGKPRGAIAAVVDISERKRAEEDQKRMLQELRHRTKNILANVASLASLLLTASGSLEDFGRALIGRLGVMGKVHELLSAGVQQSVSLNLLVLAVIEPVLNTRGDNVMMSGPDVMLPAKAATTLGMVLHELATNAVKYGALSVPNGNVEVAWQKGGQAGAERLEISWAERNGPRIEAFPTMGFGTRLVVEMIDYELEGVARLHFRPEGFRCKIEIPLLDKQE